MSTAQSTRSSRAPKKQQRKSELGSTTGRAPRNLSTLLSFQGRALHHDGAVPSQPEYTAAGAAASKAAPAGPVPTGVVHIPRRGIFFASELVHHRDAREYDREFNELEQVCVIRFPPEVASILRERLAIQSEIELLGMDDRNGSGEPVEYSAGELGLTITPTAKEDYRVFDIEVERELGSPNSAILLTGVLVELPCFIEACKSLEGELLFKSTDISQMLYVFDSTTGPPFSLTKIRDDQSWEWHSGLTPGTHRIRGRKFKNFRVFDKPDVALAEREICDITNQRSHREQAVLEASTEDLCEQHLEGLDFGTLEPNVVGVIGPDNPILKAALNGSAVMAGQPMAQQMLRFLLEKEDEFRANEKLKFSIDQSMNVTEDQQIADDLSDRLFGDWGIETEIEEDQLLDDIPGVNADQDAPSSDSSLLSDQEDVRRQRRSHKSSVV